MSEYRPPPREFEPDKLIVRMDITVRAEVGSISAIVQAILSITSDMKCAAGKEMSPTRKSLFRLRWSGKPVFPKPLVGCSNHPGATFSILHI